MHMPRCNSRALAALLALAFAPLAHGQAPTWSFSGYGTAGVVHSDYDQADYLIDAFKPSGPGHTRKWDPEVDSRIAGQVSAQLTPKLSGVVQVIMQQRHDDTWKPQVEWANLTWHLTDDFSLRAGRVVLPVFMLTDTRKVGYAYPWVRPPVEMYSLVPVTSNDGIEASWRFAFGDTRTIATSASGPSCRNTGATASAVHAANSGPSSGAVTKSPPAPNLVAPAL